MPTERLTVNVLEVDGRSGPPVLFVHGNVSSSLFWQPGRPGAVLDRYAGAGGRYQEVVVAEAAHSPHLDQPARFQAASPTTWRPADVRDSFKTGRGARP